MFWSWSSQPTLPSEGERADVSTHGNLPPSRQVLGAALVNLGGAQQSSPYHTNDAPASHRDSKSEEQIPTLRLLVSKQQEQTEAYMRSTEHLILDRFYALESSIERMLQQVSVPVNDDQPAASNSSKRNVQKSTEDALSPKMLAHLDKLFRAAEARAAQERHHMTERLVFEGSKLIEATLEREINRQSDLIENLKRDLQPQDLQPQDLQPQQRQESPISDQVQKASAQEPGDSNPGKKNFASKKSKSHVKFGDNTEEQDEKVIQVVEKPRQGTTVSIHTDDSPSKRYSKVIQGVSNEFAKAVGFGKEPTKTREIFGKNNYVSDNCLNARIQQVVHSSSFIAIMEACIVINIAIKAVQMDIDVQRAFKNESLVAWGFWVDVVFTAIFGFEIIMRLIAEHRWFFLGHQYGWNMFDLTVVTVSLFEILTDGLSLGFLRILRSLRLVRVLKIVRVFRFFRELRLMAVSIASCMTSLFWALTMIFIVVLVFAMFVLEGSKNYFLETAGEETTIRTQLFELYGSFPEAIYSLIQTVSGGGEWGFFAEPLLEVSWVYGVGFALFVSFVTLGMMNILIGIFVENAQSYSQIDRDLVIQEEIDHRESYMNQLRELFHEMDEDKSGTITYEEFNECMSHERAKAYLDFLQLNASEAQGLFMLLDLDQKGEIGVEEFVLGCMRLKGAAKSIDAAAMMFQTKRMAVKVNDLTTYVKERLEVLIRIAQASAPESL